jgi:hypothetical protein
MVGRSFHSAPDLGRYYGRELHLETFDKPPLVDLDLVPPLWCGLRMLLRN